jgi:hypothetical protein
LNLCVADGFNLASTLALRIARVDAPQRLQQSASDPIPVHANGYWIVGLFVAT